MIDLLKNNRKLSVIFLLIIAIEIFLVSSLPGEDLTSKGINLSSVYHMIAFFLFNFFLLIFLNKNKKINVKTILIALTISILYAILDEIHQSFVPLRNPSLNDILIDSIGIFTSTLIYIYSSKRKNHFSTE